MMTTTCATEERCLRRCATQRTARTVTIVAPSEITPRRTIASAPWISRNPVAAPKLTKSPQKLPRNTPRPATLLEQARTARGAVPTDGVSIVVMPTADPAPSPLSRAARFSTLAARCSEFGVAANSASVAFLRPCQHRRSSRSRASVPASLSFRVCPVEHRGHCRRLLGKNLRLRFL
jgi:hypothetical protein